MKKVKLTPLLVLLGLVLLTGCKKDDDDNNDTNDNRKTILAIDITGLEDLGDGANYEGWLIVNEVPVSTDTFRVDSVGALSRTSFEASSENLENATAFVLTIEPNPDPDPAPSSTRILAGGFSKDLAPLSLVTALGDDFSSAAGTYILATPTNGEMTDENSGVWFLKPTDPPTPSLILPTLPRNGGWKYEGWVVIDGTPVSTGKFIAAAGADEAAPHSGPEQAPPFPGEDLLLRAPSGLTFPVDLVGATIVISIEPEPDNSPAPFVLKPLVGRVPASLTPGKSSRIRNSASATSPSGTALKR